MKSKIVVNFSTGERLRKGGDGKLTVPPHSIYYSKVRFDCNQFAASSTRNT